MSTQVGLTLIYLKPTQKNQKKLKTVNKKTKPTKISSFPKPSNVYKILNSPKPKLKFGD
jgi:hypothetical protein